MAVVFADPFGSFLDGYDRGLDMRIRKEESEQTRRLNEYKLYDTFVFSPMQEIAREQRAFDRQLSLMAIRRQQAAEDRASRQAAREVDRRIAARGLRVSDPVRGGSATTATTHTLAPGRDTLSLHMPRSSRLRLSMGTTG